MRCDMYNKLNLKNNLDSIFDMRKCFDNPGKKVMNNLPQIEQDYDVSIERFWADSSNECTIIICGSKSNVGSAYKEIIKIQNDED